MSWGEEGGWWVDGKSDSLVTFSILVCLGVVLLWTPTHQAFGLCPPEVKEVESQRLGNCGPSFLPHGFSGVLSFPKKSTKS